MPLGLACKNKVELFPEQSPCLKYADDTAVLVQIVTVVNFNTNKTVKYNISVYFKFLSEFKSIGMELADCSINFVNWPMDCRLELWLGRMRELEHWPELVQVLASC